MLVEARLIDADTLTVYLGLELGIPIATRAALDRAKRAAVRLLTPELAERFLCVPLAVQDRQLIAAMKDPHDLLALDELGSATGYRIIPRVAPEVRLYYYLERYYGVPRPERFRRLGDLPVAAPARGADVVEPPPPPLPGLPPPARHLVTPPVAATPLRAIQVCPDAPDADDELAIELQADAAESAELSGPASAPAPAPPPRQAPRRHQDGKRALELDEALELVRNADSRVEIADAIIGHARALFDVAALLVVRDDLAFGWRGFGHEIDSDRIETLLVPLEAPSIFRQAIEAEDLFAGPVPPSALHAHLLKVLFTLPPRQAVVLPIAIRDRVVNLLYGQRDGDKELGDAGLDGLRLLARTASDAYVRLIALQKQGG